jgi:hypothetical protein
MSPLSTIYNKQKFQYLAVYRAGGAHQSSACDNGEEFSSVGELAI